MTVLAAGVLAGVLVAAAVLVLLPPPSAGRLHRLAAPAPRTDVPPRPEPDEALVLDLVSAAMLAGAAGAVALQVAGSAAGGRRGAAVRTAGAALMLGADGDEAWPDDDAVRRLRRCLELSAATGVPAVPLLRAAADTARRDRHRALEREAARLGVRLTLPLGLCAVPAFVAWGVVPVVLSLGARVAP